MKVSIFQFRASWVLSAMLVCGLTEAADSSIEMSDEEIARLGVELGMPRRVDGIAHRRAHEGGKRRHRRS